MLIVVVARYAVAMSGANTGLIPQAVAELTVFADCAQRAVRSSPRRMKRRRRSAGAYGDVISSQTTPRRLVLCCPTWSRAPQSKQLRKPSETPSWIRGASAMPVVKPTRSLDARPQRFLGRAIRGGDFQPSRATIVNKSCDAATSSVRCT